MVHENLVTIYIYIYIYKEKRAFSWDYILMTRVKPQHLGQ